ncbi:flavocytochrome c [Paucilactobacillus kaifaensis]|uniref:flavocytochrome c n=1 Tax=Paucilactobacillus kaifaensis TaxID=2559921 RepID=UPI0010F63781|nr:flavocytochrome c [Paucilactobacillus kaifaensis]
MAESFQFQANKMAELVNNYDVIIVGSGATGLTSAVQAAELGLKPVILEKMAKIGGNSTRASSGMNAAETIPQLQHHIVDSMDEFYSDTFIGGGQQNDPQLLRYFTDHSALAVEWLAHHDINLDDVTITGGMHTKRTHRPSSMKPIGGFLVTQLLKQIAKKKIPLFTDVQVTKLLRDETGQITGVQAQTEGHEIKITSGAVILATGGFGANAQLISEYQPELKKYPTTNQAGATGDGIKLGISAGAQAIAMDQIQVHPTVAQVNNHAYLIGEAVRGEGAILVNQAGQRFVDELNTRKQVTAAIEKLHENGAYLIFNQAVRERVQAIEFYASIGLVQTGDDLNQLATGIQIDPDTLNHTITEWNGAVKNHSDHQFQRTTGMERDLSQGPYYAIHIAPAVHYTMGGLKINSQTQVIDKQDRVIDGLFAAGEVAGGLHGNNRIGGNSIAETVIFGCQAGQQVFRYLQKR